MVPAHFTKIPAFFRGDGLSRLKNFHLEEIIFYLDGGAGMSRHFTGAVVVPHGGLVQSPFQARPRRSKRVADDDDDNDDEDDSDDSDRASDSGDDTDEAKEHIEVFEEDVEPTTLRISLCLIQTER